jgi:drug/metabolite transporter (DMT)-like permease
MSKKTGHRFEGVVFGFTAGTMMAFQSISKRISTISEALLPGIILTCIFAILTLLITQIGFTRAKASQVVSSFTSASILVASVASIFILSESMNGLQFLGIAAVVMGVLFITIFRPGAQQKDK